MLLYFDTATTGLWRWKAPVDAPEQPQIVRLAALLATPEGEAVERFCWLIRPLPAWPPIEREATAFHGIDQHTADTQGRSLGPVMARFETLLDRAAHLVAHNAVFHWRVIHRAWQAMHHEPITLPTPSLVCTMREAADVVQVRLQGNAQWKWPSLNEAYTHFAGRALLLPEEPEQRGLATAEAVRLIHQGITRARGTAAAGRAA